MFKNDHICDENKLKSMVANANGQLAEPLQQSDSFECHICQQKFDDISKFSEHLDDHENQNEEQKDDLNSGARVQHIVIDGDGAE